MSPVKEELPDVLVVPPEEFLEEEFLVEEELPVEELSEDVEKQEKHQ